MSTAVSLTPNHQETWHWTVRCETKLQAPLPPLGSCPGSFFAPLRDGVDTPGVRFVMLINPAGTTENPTCDSPLQSVRSERAFSVCRCLWPVEKPLFTSRLACSSPAFPFPPWFDCATGVGYRPGSFPAGGCRSPAAEVPSVGFGGWVFEARSPRLELRTR